MVEFDTPSEGCYFYFMKKKWKDIPGYEGSYQVSSDGEVRGLPRVVPGGRWGEQFVPGGIVSQTKHNSGYQAVHLRLNGKRTKHLVHRLVVEAFLGPKPFEKAEIRHLNDVKTDNRIENLVWGTRSENIQDREKNVIGYYFERTECRNGHELTEWNLVPNQLKLRNGIKTCYACQRAHYMIKNHVDLKGRNKEVADVYFEALKSGKKRVTYMDVVEFLKTD